MQDHKITRRRFLGSSATILAGCGFPFVVHGSTLGRDGVAPSNRIVMGCIGNGNQNTNNMKGFLNNKNAQVVAVCDVNRASFGYRYDTQYLGREPARQEVNDYYTQKNPGGSYKGCKAYVDFRDVLTRKDIDAVTIVVPDHWHAIMAIEAARCGKDIYCEKPLALTINEGKEMVKAVRQYGVVFQTGSHCRSSSHIRRACELIQNGRIGKLLRMHTVLDRHPVREEIPTWQPMPVPDGFDYDRWLGPAPAAPYHPLRCLYRFRFLMDYAGGEATNTGAHCFDIAQWANGTQLTGPVEVQDLGGQYPSDGMYTTPIRNHFRFRYANGVELVCEPEWPKDNPDKYAARFEGTEGWIQIGYPWQTQLITSPTRLAQSHIGPDEIHLYESKDHYGNFLDCVRSRQDPVAPVEVGHRSATICHLGNIVMKLKRKLKWDPQKEEFVNDPEANRFLSRAMRSPWHL